MLWARGELVADDVLSISALDRTFEHGLGLFETLRTWNGHATLLERHLKRLRQSARELGLPLEAAQLPDPSAVAALVAASGNLVAPGKDVRLRITLSGGRATEPASGSLLWMSAGPLPLERPGTGAVISTTLAVSRDDPLARHKTLNYWRRRLAHAEAVAAGCDDALCLTTNGLICEASRSNIFVVEGRRLCTPSLDGPVLPGVMRHLVLEWAEQAGLEVEETSLPVERIGSVDEAFLTNSVRGVVPIATLMGVEYPAPGPATQRLWNEILAWLERGGSTA
jgi:branched-chain amino acid aminotransferase